MAAYYFVIHPLFFLTIAQMMGLLFGEDRHHLVDALIQTKFGVFAHLSVWSRHVIFCYSHFSSIVAKILEDHNGAGIFWKIGGHANAGRIDPIAILVRQVLDEFDPLHGHDLLIDPGVVKILSAEIGRCPHTDKGCAAFAKIDLCTWRSEVVRPPPLHNILGIGPGLPDQFNWRIKRTSDDQVVSFHV